MQIARLGSDARVGWVIPFVLVLATCVGPSTAGSAGAPDPANAIYRIGSDTVTLTNGRAEREAAPGSATKVVTTLADQRVNGDVDGDGRTDAVVILVHQPGGSGTFYYVATLLNTSTGVIATPGVLLGDRIKVNAVRLEGRVVVVDLLDRSAGQPLAASPTVAITKRFAIDGGALVGR